MLRIENLNARIGATPVLNDITLDIEAGGFLVLVGPSGCGKSTLLNCVAGLVRSSSGTIQIGGRNMSGVAPKDRDIAMVFQSYALYPTMSVAKNITFGMEVRGLPRGARDERLKRVARLLHLDDYLARKPSQLSGGQRQRVAMGRALVREPKLFLFDEPLSNLDAKLRVEMRTEIKRLHQSSGGTFVYVTHDQTEAMMLATKIAVMKDGMIQQVGTPPDLYYRPRNLFVADFMGSPSMNFIPASAQRADGFTRLRIERPAQEPCFLIAEDAPLDLRNGEKKEILLGLRPEAISCGDLGSQRTLNVVDCKLDIVELAGPDAYVITRLGGGEVTARISAGVNPLPHSMLPLHFDVTQASYFDPVTGERIEEKEPLGAIGPT